mmetsp:Transcript_6292/g.23705  ORF Transcript_6292/g.23705 Transcript_6292/m.23705 type:complete len:792 (-) Transcript_6292:2811-5186(-)
MPSSYASKFQRQKHAPIAGSPMSATGTYQHHQAQEISILSPSGASDLSSAVNSPHSKRSGSTGRYSGISSKRQDSSGNSSAMQQIRLQTLRRRQRFKKMQEKEKERERLRRERVLKERKQRLRELDPLHDEGNGSVRSGATGSGDRYLQQRRKRPSRATVQQHPKPTSRLVESLDLQSSVHDSTQVFRLAEKLARERDVSASKAVDILERKRDGRATERMAVSNCHASKGNATTANNRPPAPSSDANSQHSKQMQERINARQRFIGQKFKLQPIEVRSAKDGSSTEKSKRRFNRRGQAGRQTPGSVVTPGTPNTIHTTFTAHTEPLGRFPGDSSSVLSSNYDFDADSILSAPSRINNDSKKKKTRSRPWREKPVIPQRKDFETGYSVEISNVENSIANLDKLLDRKKEVIKKAARERVLWLKAEEERKRKKREELANKENVVQNRIPHEDYEKYLPDAEDEVEEDDLIEEDVADETVASLLRRTGKQSSVSERNTRAPMSQDTGQSHAPVGSTPAPNGATPSGTRPRRVSFSRGGATRAPTPTTTPPSSKPNLIRRVPSNPNQHNGPIQKTILPRVPSMNTLQQLPSGSGRDLAEAHIGQPISSPSHDIRSTTSGQSQHQISRIQEDIAPLASTIRTTHRPVGTILRRSPKGGLSLRNRRFTSTTTRANSQLPPPSRVPDFEMVVKESPSNARQNEVGRFKSTRNTQQQPSFLENSVQIDDDDIPAMPLYKKHSFGKQVDTRTTGQKRSNKAPPPRANKTSAHDQQTEDAMEGGGQINVADSHVLELLGLK